MKARIAVEKGVQDRHALEPDEVPEAIAGGRIERALGDPAGCAVRERSVDDVGVSGDQADVGGAPEDVLFFEVEDPFAVAYVPTR